MPNRFSINTATVVMLVLLRLCIGWHFYSEGAKHYTDPHWTSEPVLRAARGPLAPMYHAYLPDFHGFERMLHAPASESDEHAVQGWIDEVQKDWDVYRQEFSAHYALDEARLKQANRILGDYQAKVRDWAHANSEALATHVHEWRRKENTRQQPAGDLPFQKKRIAERQGQLAGETGGWTSELKKVEKEYQQALAAIVPADQRSSRPLAMPVRSIDTVDKAMTWIILSVGVLLILGLFTRVACVAGAMFLFSVVMMQPFWVADTVPTFNQYVEMFALLTLATTQVGRWAGLDFFLANKFSGSKGKSDAPQS